MDILLQDISKKYGFNWIFKSVTYSFQQGKSYAIVGHNGSGKSTLLQIILGTVLPSKGKVVLPFPKDESHRFVSFVAPYQQLPKDLTLREIIDLHFNCRKLDEGISKESIITSIRLEGKEDVQLQHFSSGMLQRVKLALALYTQSKILLLDEPTISLDQENMDWYLEEIQQRKEGKIVIISSNEEKEYSFCDEKLDITSYK